MRFFHLLFLLCSYWFVSYLHWFFSTIGWILLIPVLSTLFKIFIWQSLKFRANGDADLCLLAYQTIIALSFNYLPGINYVLVHSFLIFFGSFIVFLQFHLVSSYYNEKVLIFLSVLSSINFWTAIMLIFANVKFI